MRLSWPLVGRTEEMRAIETAIADPDVAGVLIYGAEGVGKSRITREALAVVAATSTADVVLGVDDVHLLDELSVFVVHQIVHRRAAQSNFDSSRWRAGSR